MLFPLEAAAGALATCQISSREALLTRHDIKSGPCMTHKNGPTCQLRDKGDIDADGLAAWAWLLVDLSTRHAGNIVCRAVCDEGTQCLSHVNCECAV